MSAAYNFHGVRLTQVERSGPKGGPREPTKPEIDPKKEAMKLSSTETPDSEPDPTVFANPTEVVHHLALGVLAKQGKGDTYTAAEYTAALEGDIRVRYPRLYALSQTPGARQAELKQAEARYRREGLMS
jgi:hypothetical protein